MPLVISGAVSGSTTLQATDAVTATITLPSATDTLVGKITPSFTTTIGVGNATPSASGAGITFPATQSASTDANTLDDYEEGTWTPVIKGSSTAGTGTYTSQTGVYTKIGNVVYFSSYIGWSAHTGTGDIFLDGLPFTSNSSVSYYGAVYFGAINMLTLSASNYLQGYILNSTTVITLSGYPVGGGATTTIPMDTAASFMTTGFYYI